MKIKEYTPEYIHANIDKLRIVIIDNWKGKMRVGKPNIVSVSAKQLKTNGRVVNFAKIGTFQQYGASWFMEEDIEESVRIYKENTIAKHQSRIDFAEGEIKKTQALEVVYDLGGE